MRPDTLPHTQAGCRLLEWDSEFFGRRIAQVEPSHLLIAEGRATEEWCIQQQVDCAYLLIDVSDHAACAVAQARGFRLVDVRVTLETVAPAPRVLPVRADRPVVRLAERGDVETLKAIAHESHRDTRFYVDERFDRRRCDDLYEHWIARSCDGWADRVFVVDAGGVPAGYLTCHLRDRVGQIGLVAVGPAARAQGAGSALVNAALTWYADHGVDHVSVVTQAHNQAALRLYQRAGMTVQRIQLWFHRWW
jgi:ribosomal protein S18 acetylase RimI-like enzyme